MKPRPFIWLCGTGLFVIFSSTLSKSPVLPLLAAHLEWSPSEVGIIASVSTLTGVLFSFPAGLLSDRFGRKNLLKVLFFRTTNRVGFVLIVCQGIKLIVRPIRVKHLSFPPIVAL